MAEIIDLTVRKFNRTLKNEVMPIVVSRIIHLEAAPSGAGIGTVQSLVIVEGVLNNDKNKYWVEESISSIQTEANA